jgi:hypothetical protein
VRISHVAPPAGDDGLSVKGTLALAPPVEPVVDPVAYGLHVRVADGDGVVLDLTLPPGAYDPVAKTGWKVNKTGNRWTYVGPKTSPPGGVTKMVLAASQKVPGRVTFACTGKKGAYEADTGIVAELGLPGAGLCFQASFPATPPAKPSCAIVKSTLKCR